MLNALFLRASSDQEIAHEGNKMIRYKNFTDTSRITVEQSKCSLTENG